jgi:hypothetical protein
MYQEISVTGTDQHPVQSVEMQINDTVERMSNTGDSARRSKINNHEVTKSTGGNANQGQDQDNIDNSSATNYSPASLTCGFEVEKPKLPRFSQDVRDYFIFRPDFSMPLIQGITKGTRFHFCGRGKPLELGITIGLQRS